MKNKIKRNIRYLYIIVLAFSVLYVVITLLYYPKLTFTPEMLYGENLQNLKDFTIIGDKLVSQSGDAWISYQLEEDIPIKVVEFNIEELSDKNVSGELYDTDSWSCYTYDLRNGRTWAFTPGEGREMSRLRFDLVTSGDVSFRLKEVTINSTYGMVFSCLKTLALVYILLWGIVTVLSHISKEYKGSSRGKKALFVLKPVVIIGTASLYFVARESADMTNALIKWMTLALLAVVLLMVADRRKKDDVLRTWGEFIIFSFLHLCLIEIVSGIACENNSAWIYIWNLSLVIFVGLLFYLVSRSIRLTMVATNVIIILLAVVNHYYYIFRNNPFELSDLIMADTAMAVISNYVLQIDLTMGYLIVCEIGIILYISLYRHIVEYKTSFFKVLLFECFVLGISCFYTPEVDYWNKTACVKEQGYVASFLQYAKRDMKTYKPEGYSSDEISGILAQYDKENTTVGEETMENVTMNGETPNVIVIMNEAFSDFPETYEFETNVDGMPFIHSLQEDTVKGSLYVSVVGGSTANTEYEFLTGNSMALINGSVPYMQFVKREQQSLAQELKNMGYQTIAYHPNVKNNYDRDDVYPLLGFERFVSLESGLKDTTEFRGYISDAANNNNIIDIYEKRDVNAPLFLFNVSMQNHGGYSNTVTAEDCEVVPVKEELRHPQLMEYLSSIKKTDEAFEELVQYFESSDEKTIICMFGDHQPGFDAKVRESLGFSEDTLQEKQQMFEVPFIIWANYDIEEEENVVTSANYLRAKLLQTAGMTLSDYDSFLLKCSEQYPAINGDGYMDTSGEWNYIDIEKGVEGILHTYHKLQYANMFDKSLERELFLK